ncbi:hypothetical protein AC579_5712 [Pseudocercospora musae]|uniref:AAA+ ATPase domain-containing protein n=1 Tax=Pseudocercospora musae TaxID=113226 RepID=A0A139ISE3_9PEZI|nr:hypothetical protein AC579_5712 [Pseudocercospora musae]
MSHFHAGGAAHLRLHHLACANGIAHLRAIFLDRLSALDFTHFGSILAIAGIVPAAWRFVHQSWHNVATWVKRFFISSATVPAGDPLNRSVSTWVLESVVEPRNLRFQTARTDITPRDRDPAASLKKSQRAIHYLPFWTSVWFWHEGRLFAATRILDNFNANLSDPNYDGVGGEELTLSCLGLSANPIRALIEVCREYAQKKQQFYVIIYSRDRYGMSWKPKYRKPLRQLDTVHFDDVTKQVLIEDIRNYLDERTQKLYQSRSMPYRRGYLFYGPPGTGKSSLSTAIAGEFGLDLYEVKVPSIANDADLEQMFSEIPPRCIVLLEDIDAVWSMNREQRHERHLNVNDPNSDAQSTHSQVSNVTLSGLLNVLDGVGSQEGRVVIMTTNKPEQLDAALVRPGRVDFKLYLGNISRQSAAQMFLRMFAPDLLSWAQKGHGRKECKYHSRSISRTIDGLDQHVSMEQLKLLATQFADQIPEGTLTPSQLQGFFQLHLSSAAGAASSIAAWVQKQMAARSDKEWEP